MQCAEAVNPAKLVLACLKRGAGNQLKKTGFPVKPEMTIKAEELSTREQRGGGGV